MIFIPLIFLNGNLIDNSKQHKQTPKEKLLTPFLGYRFIIFAIH